MSSTSTTTRPGTPFPTTESISYFNLTSAQTSTSSRRLSTSIHFPMPTRPVLTPPSLLQRTSSTGSSSSHSYNLSKTPGFHGRRSSTCSSSSECSSSMSSPMPTTPMVIAEEEEEEINFGSSFKLPEAFTLNTPTKSKPSSVQYPYSTSIETTSPFTMAPPSRPKLKRRDTPRPKTDIFSMAPLRQVPALASVEEDIPRRRFTSIVDGKSWVAVA